MSFSLPLVSLSSCVFLCVRFDASVYLVHVSLTLYTCVLLFWALVIFDFFMFLYASVGIGLLSFLCMCFHFSLCASALGRTVYVCNLLCMVVSVCVPVCVFDCICNGPCIFLFFCDQVFPCSCLSVVSVLLAISLCMCTH